MLLNKWKYELLIRRKFLYVLLVLPCIFLFGNCSKSGVLSTDSVAPGQTSCATLDCTTLKYSLFSADLNGSNVTVIRTSGNQEMTHPRLSNDKNWVSYTAYNDRDSQGCASLSIGYFNTEIRAVKLDGSVDKRVIAPVVGQFNSNNYWLGTTNEMSYLSGPPTALKIYRASVDVSMNLIAAPRVIPTAASLSVVLDPQANLGANKIVFSSIWNNSGNFVKSIFIMNLNDSSNVVGLSVGRNRAGTILTCPDSACANIMENDPKISPDGTQVAFMRQAPSSGVNGFGWHIFVVPIDSPLSEKDISYSYIGSNVLKNEVLPEWIDNTTLVFSTIEIVSSSDVTKNVYTMKSDGSQRTKVSLPSGFKYSDVFPYTDASGKKRLIISAEKIGASCAK